MEPLPAGIKLQCINDARELSRGKAWLLTNDSELPLQYVSGASVLLVLELGEERNMV